MGIDKYVYIGNKDNVWLYIFRSLVSFGNDVIMFLM
jgi:hypothetical protein